MTYEANKYRIQPYIKTGGRQQIVRRTRLEAIKEIASFLAIGDRVSIKDFHQRDISSEHRSKLKQIAVLWGELDKLEAAVKARKTNAKVK